ncbi:MAG: hypothetical protein J5780_01065 [Treponema sp.]|nr:hypothetical protein [Treponema sp.]
MKISTAHFCALAAFSALTLSLFSCGSTKVSTVELPLQTAYGPERSYFSSVDTRTFEAVCDASPQNLRMAFSALHKSVDDDYRENEKVLLTLCSDIMRIVWPSEVVAWDVPETDRNNHYLGAVDSSLRGIYDSSTGGNDFLAKVLPSLVLITSTTHSGYYEESFKSLSDAAAIYPESTLVNFLLGTLERRRGNFTESLAYFQTAQKKAPLNFEIQLNVAQAYYYCGNFEMALSLGEQILLLRPQDVEVLSLCSRSSYSLGSLEKAESYVVRLLSVEPENREYILLRARILIDKTDYIRASSLLDVYSRSDTSARDYLLLRAKLQRDWNKNSTASSETIARALMLYPDDREVLLFAAELASSANTTVNEMKALELSQRILAVDKDNIQASQILIAEMIKAGRWQEAYDLSSPLIKREGAPLSASYRHVEICLALKKNQEALSIAQGMYSKNQNDEEAQQSYIKVLVATGQRNSALQLISSLMTNSNQKMKSFLYYQRSFFASGEEAVLSDLRSSLTLNPRNRDALYRLYEIYYSKRDWRRSQYYLKQVVALDPTNQDLLKRNSELDRLLGK